VESGEKRGKKMSISRASRIMNEDTIDNFLNTYLNETMMFEKIALLGLAFKGKPETKDLRGSAVYPVHQRLYAQFPHSVFSGYEPAGIDRLELPAFSIAKSLAEAVSEADLVILLTNSESFSQSPQEIARFATGHALILDFWGRKFETDFLNTQTYISWSGGVK
jgi:UDP-N-acetyl-D-mannosaminuronic acid dehydrogenase